MGSPSLSPFLVSLHLHLLFFFFFYLVLKNSPTSTSPHIYTPIHVGALRTHPGGCVKLYQSSEDSPRLTSDQRGHRRSVPGSHGADMPRRKQQAPRRAAGTLRLQLTSLSVLVIYLCRPFLPIKLFKFLFVPSFTGFIF